MALLKNYNLRTILSNKGKELSTEKVRAQIYHRFLLTSLLTISYMWHC